MPAHVADVQIRQRRHSRRGTTALYTVAFNGRDDTRVEQLYVGYEFPQDALDAEYRSALSEATVAPALGRAVTLIPEANLVLVAFPNDRRMRALGEEALLACVGRLATVLADRERREPAWRVKEANFNILRYVPGQRSLFAVAETSRPTEACSSRSRSSQSNTGNGKWRGTSTTTWWHSTNICRAPAECGCRGR